MALTSGSLVKATGAAAVGDADLTGAVTTSGGVVTTLATGLSPNFAAVSVASQKLQSFTIAFVNTAGTIQHKICQGIDLYTTLPTFCDKITGASTTLANTPTVSAGVDFVSGVGIVSNVVVLNTAAQIAVDMLAIVDADYYDGNVLRPRARPSFISRDVNGTTRIRLEIGINNDMTNAGWTINTTNLPAGKFLTIRFHGYLA